MDLSQQLPPLDSAASRLDAITERVAVGVAGGPEGFAGLTLDRGRKEAALHDRRKRNGQALGQIDGLTIAWKDVFPIKGFPTMAGTRFLPGDPAPTDHILVKRLSLAGAICLGKTALTELSFSVLGESAVQTPPSNPYSGAEARVCGGSSSGSASVVARDLADASIGTDSGGSIRLPAAWCNLVGFKPTHARNLIEGATPFSPSLDTAGPLAPSVAIASAVFKAMMGAESLVPGTATHMIIPPIPEGASLSKAVSSVWHLALHRLTDAGLCLNKTDQDVIGDAYRFRDQYGSIAAVEGSVHWRSTVLAAGSAVSTRLRGWFERSVFDDSEALLRTQLAARAQLIRRFSKSVPEGAVLLTPTSPIEPPKLSDLDDEERYDALYAQSHALLWPFNLYDAPAITVPCGMTETGLPVGLQVVAPQGCDARVLDAASKIEATLNLHPTNH